MIFYRSEHYQLSIVQNEQDLTTKKILFDIRLSIIFAIFFLSDFWDGFHIFDLKF